MTKQIITNVLLQSADVRHKDANTLASLILVTIRDAIIHNKTLRLPGVGTFESIKKTSKVGRRDLAEALYSSGKISQAMSMNLAGVVVDFLKKQTDSGAVISLSGVGDITPADPQAPIFQGSIKFRPSRALFEKSGVRES